MGGYKQIGDKPLRNYKNRKRYITIGFRVTPAQKELIHERVRLSGRTIQDYMVQSALQSRVVVMGNEKLRLRMIDELKPVVEKLETIEDIGCLDTDTAKALNEIFKLTSCWE